MFIELLWYTVWVEGVKERAEISTLMERTARVEAAGGQTAVHMLHYKPVISLRSSSAGEQEADLRET